jgi:hypothetical protein
MGGSSIFKDYINNAGAHPVRPYNTFIFLNQAFE